MLRTTIFCWTILVANWSLAAHNAVHWTALCCLELVLAACSPQLVLDTLRGQTMGTTWSVTIANLPARYDATALTSEIEEILAAVNREMSTYDPTSEISRFNDAPADGAWFFVSDRFAEVTAKALGFAVLSDGAFDPTVGPLVNLWGFGPEATAEQLPSDQAIAAARADVGYQALAVRAPEQGAALSKTAPRQLDLSAIAKGAGVDAIAEHLITRGLDNFLVDIGGELRAVGQKDGRGWRVAIEQPTKGVRDVQRIITLSDQSIATSGDYRNYREIDGVSYSHTIDPKTGRPVTHQLASVSVAADSCTLADGWATTLLALGPEQGFAFAEARGLAALFIERSGTTLSVRETTRWMRDFSSEAQ